MLTPSSSLGIDFSSLRNSRFNVLVKGKKLMLSRLEKYAFMRLLSNVSLGSPSIHPFIMELLSHFNIVLRQLMPNSWRIVISCMEIWMVITKGDMIRLDEFVHLYHLKESKEYGYYKLVLGSGR